MHERLEPAYIRVTRCLLSAIYSLVVCFCLLFKQKTKKQKNGGTSCVRLILLIVDMFAAESHYPVNLQFCSVSLDFCLFVIYAYVLFIAVVFVRFKLQL